MYMGESPTFRRNISPPSLGSKGKRSKKEAEIGGDVSFSPGTIGRTVIIR
jgi:hypothetical protein